VILVTTSHLRELNHCARGWRRWCKQYGFDFRELVDRGLDADAVEATGDEFGKQAAALARAKAKG
jgi:hypothetical protein